MNQEQYREKCEVRRRGAIVETLADGAWSKVNLDNFEHRNKDAEGVGINRAKRWVRANCKSKDAPNRPTSYTLRKGERA